MPGVWFTSDLHLGHKLVAAHRGFLDEAGEPDVNHHDAALWNNWFDQVHPRDQVWVLGDINVGNPEAALRKLALLPGEKHLIAGNHDKCHPVERRSHVWLPRYLQVFASVQLAARRKVAGRTVLLSHFPYVADRGETRYEQWRLADRGEWLLHGHTHSDRKWTSGSELHVGLDAWELRLVPLAAIELAIS